MTKIIHSQSLVATEVNKLQYETRDGKLHKHDNYFNNVLLFSSNYLDNYEIICIFAPHFVRCAFMS